VDFGVHLRGVPPSMHPWHRKLELGGSGEEKGVHLSRFRRAKGAPLETLGSPRGDLGVALASQSDEKCVKKHLQEAVRRPVHFLVHF